jgi:hypothetical protein
MTLNLYVEIYSKNELLILSPHVLVDVHVDFLIEHVNIGE